MWIEQMVMAFLGLGGGFLVAAGVVALLVGLGIITRFTGITRTAAHSRLYESAILFGALGGDLLTVYQFSVPAGRIGLALLGLSAGIYVGGWIMALAEVVNIFPIFARRVGMTKGASFLVIAIALGKTVGSLLFFFKRW